VAGDESAALEAHEVMKRDNFYFLFGWNEGVEWSAWLKSVAEHRRGLSLSVGLVPAAQLAADVDGVIVGRVSIRFQLNKDLARFGGHIGYGVLPDHRRRGYATEILHQALVIARSEGLTRVLVTCAEGNVASARVIEKCGGVLEGVVAGETGTERLRHYWIE
jgi:predicted acetyltransferase